MKCRDLTWRVQQEHLAFAIFALGQEHGRGVKPRMLDKLRVGSEGQPADLRVQPVCPDDEVETTRLGMPERHIHPKSILGEGRDGIAEDVLGIVGARVVKDTREITARDLEILGRNG
jgi:hypothetical protein